MKPELQTVSVKGKVYAFSIEERLYVPYSIEYCWELFHSLPS